MPDILSLNQLIARRVREHPDLPVLAIPDKVFNYTKYTTSEIDAAASLLANHLKDTGALPGREKGDATSKLTVGLLGVNNIEYVIAEMALYRMGYCVLFISPNNSPPAIAHLLTVTNSSHIFVQDTQFRPATEALAHLADPSLVSIIRQPPSDVFGSDARIAHPDKTRWDPPLTPEAEHLLPINIIHSSGSSGFPKPIVTNNKAAVGSCKTNLGLTALTTMPLYHGFGHANMLRAWYAAKPLYVFPTASIPLTSANIINLLSQAPDAQAFYAVPFALRLLAETQEGLRMLKRLKVVSFSGSPCPDDLGDYLVSEGVPLVGYYGMTEMGQLMSTMRDMATDKEWNWMRAKGPHVRSRIHEYSRFEARGSGTYELVILDGWPTKVMTNQSDGSYATKDLFIKHPTIPDAYKYIGRLDDTLVMFNGEKTNPIPIELKLRSSPYVADAIVFGGGRTQIGALILPADIAQHFSREGFAQRIAPTVALANVEAPSHSQLSTEALVFLPYGTQIPRSDKGFMLRAKVYKEFEKVIEEIYERLEGEGGPEGKKQVKGEADARVVVRELIARTIEKPVDLLKEDTDLFEFGLDSLQSTRIRNAIQREIDLGGEKLPINAVFEYPSIAKLAKLVVLLSSGKDDADAEIRSRQLMLELVEKYGHFTYSSKVQLNGVSAGSPEKVVILTGATGFLGAHILNELLADPDVVTIYCPCRAEDDAHATERLAASLKTRKLLDRFSDPQLRASERVIALAADVCEARLGLGEERYREIASRVTAIIHNAWPVNFNLDVSSFETHVRGTVNLMHLALSSPHAEPAKFFFTSSTSSVSGWPGPGLIPEAVVDDPAVARDLGYAQSKWVVERLCQIAAQTTPLRTTVLRVGQMVGDTTHGIWSESISVSLVIKCADTIGVLPEHDEPLSWVPVDYAAKAIVEIVNLPTAQAATCPVYHVVQAAPILWTAVLAALDGARLHFKRVPRHEWLRALRASDPDERRNPSRKLLAFYEGKYGGDEVKSGMGVGLGVDKALAVSKWVREMPMVDEVLIAKWVGAWRESGFLRQA